MSYFLLIDTALNTATVALARDTEILAFRQNNRPTDHAAWLHPAMQALLEESGLTPDQLDAVSVVAGPGSYTGLRVGMAAAKGICFTQQIPLITISSLLLLAAGVQASATDVIISLIDARRDEVYAGVFDHELNLLANEAAIVLGPDSFLEWRKKNNPVYTGNGSDKVERLIGITNIHLPDYKSPEINFGLLTYKKFCKKEFADLAYSEPMYIKEFYTTSAVSAKDS